MSKSLREVLTAWLDSDNPVKRTHARHRLAAMGPETESYPSLPRMAVNAAKAAVGFVASVFAIASEDEQARRLAICQEPCEHYDAKQRRCRKCGCKANLKARIASSGCPIAKW